MRASDLIARYARVEVGVLIQHREKHAGDLNATYWMEYPSIEHALEAVADDLFEGRVEKMTAGGEVIAGEEIAALTD